ncbi:hypothetical protein PPYR_08068 [Photinus pyralis]|uniref:Integrase catalytic domain-containing protein n=1 Tax=Photinus pyralis TaxID=7054 RepID=A0A5N4AID6_PHOPY|nr:hypothetical protein PPYR_08068 [Photinus pyralis]
MLYSDRGSNFVGAKSQLKDLFELIRSENFKTQIEAELTIKGIQWNFIAPGAPHMGGLWESNIKSVKSHLLKIVGDQLLTYEELNTLLIQIECLLNSRPLCVLSSDPAEPIALTPAHFLTLTPLDRLPAINVMDVNLSRLRMQNVLENEFSRDVNLPGESFLRDKYSKLELTCIKCEIKCKIFPIRVGTSETNFSVARISLLFQYEILEHDKITPLQ